MANSKSAEKKARQALARRDRNRAGRSSMKTAVKRLREAVAQGDATAAQELLPKTVSLVNATASNGVIHRNTAARTTSRLATAVNRLQGK